MMQKDQKEKENAKEILRIGMSSEFWRLLSEGLDDNIENLRKMQDSDEMQELAPEQYKLRSELLKAKKKYLTDLKKLPQSLIDFLSDPQGNNEDPHNFDPYYTSEELGRELAKR